MPKPKRFTNLHSHTTFSVGDAIGYPNENFEFVLKNGGDSMAITDHGNMAAFSHAFLTAKELKKQGRDFKYIPGCEMYLHPDLAKWRKVKSDTELIKKKGKAAAIAEGADGVENEDASKTNKWLNPINRRHHLVVLAKNPQGLKNLFTLVSRSAKEGFYKFPRIDYSMLKEHGEGLVICSACIAGPLAYDVLSTYTEVPWEELGPVDPDEDPLFSEAMRKIRNTCDVIIDAVGAENFFPEIQFNSLGAQHLVNQHLIELAKETRIQLVATADSHYCRPDYWQSREIYKMMAWHGKKDYTPEDLPASVDDLKCELYPKNAEQMWDSYEKYCEPWRDTVYNDQLVSDAIERSHDIAHQLVGDPDPDVTVKLPAPQLKEDETEIGRLTKLSIDGLKGLGLHTSKEHVQRLKRELGVMKDLKISRYFLTMKRIIDIAREHMLIGVARGSSAGSLVCYCLGITQIDPLKYNLLFERFINRHRAELPDIDCIASSHRVLMADGSVVPILDVRVGDSVIDMHGDSRVVLSVIYRYVRSDDTVYRLLVEQAGVIGTIVCVGHHKLITQDGSKIFARDLEKGSLLHGKPNVTKVLNKQVISGADDITLVDIEVEGSHTFSIFPFDVLIFEKDLRQYVGLIDTYLSDGVQDNEIIEMALDCESYELGSTS